MSRTHIVSIIRLLSLRYILFLWIGVLGGGPASASAMPTVVHARASHRATMAEAPCSNSTLKLTMSPCDNSVTGQMGLDTLSISINNSSGTTSQTVYPVVTGCSGVVSSCYATPSSVFVPFTDANDFLVIWTNSTPGTGTITVTVGGMTSTITVTVPAPFALDTTTTNLTDQMLSLCAKACFAGTTSYSTVPYYTLDTPRRVTLAYTEERAHPRPVVYADVLPIWATTYATQYTLQATLNGTKLQFVNGDTLIYFSGSTTTVRLAGQFDASAYTTGVYSLVVTVTGIFSGGAIMPLTYSRPLIIVNEAASTIAKGWTIAGLQHLYISGSTYLITDGTGSAVYFSGLGSQATDYTTLTYNPSGGYYVRAYPDSSHVYFNTTGQCLGSVDRLGFVTEYGYTGTQLTSIIDPERYIRGAGTYLSLAYGTYGLDSISEVGGSAGRTTNVTVASDGTLRTIKDPDGVSTSISYDASGRLSTVTDRRGEVETFNYNANSWKLSELDLPQIAADIGGGSTTNVIPKIKDTPWQTQGVPTTSTSSTSPATPIVRIAVQATVTDPIGRVTTTTVNRYGQSVTTTDPLGNVTTLTYQQYLPTQVAAPSGGIDTVTYLVGTPLVSSMHSMGDSVVHYHYGVNNQVDSVWGSGMQAQFRFLNSTTGRVDSIRYAGTNSLKSLYTYDSYNRLTSVVDPGKHTLTYIYDPTFGNVDSTTSPGALYTVTHFDAFGRDSLSRASGSGSVWTWQVYDLLNRPIKRWHAKTGVTAKAATATLTYDSLYLVRVTTPQSQVYKFATNALGRVTTRYDSYNPSVYMSFRYDTAGRRTSWTNRRTQRIDQTYDVLDRPLTQSVNGTLTDSMSYSLDGLTTRAVHFASGGTVVSRDTIVTGINGMTSAITRHLGSHRYVIHYGYSSPYAGGKRTVTDSSDAAGIVFSQETDGVLDSLPARDTIILTGTHEGGTSILYRNRDGLPDTLAWPAAHHALTWSHTENHETYSASAGTGAEMDSVLRSVGLDSLGRVTLEIGGENPATGHFLLRGFVYDSLGQLLEVGNAIDSLTAACGSTLTSDTVAFGASLPSCPMLSATIQDSATYDTVGNRLFPGASYSTTGNHLLTGPSGLTYSYDADGNLTTRVHSGVTDAFYWNAIGQLDSVVSGSLHHWYQYNTFGQIVQRQTKVGTGSYGVDRYFVWDGTQLVAELSGTSQLIAQYVYYGGTDHPFAIVTDSGGTAKVRYYYQDPQEGNLTAVLRDTATMDQFTRYTAWGQLSSRPINVLADTNRLGWKGLMYEGDSTRLYYVRNRWYDPVVGRFVSEDPSGLAGGSTNLYTYSHNDPINGSDPTGLCPPADWNVFNCGDQAAAYWAQVATKSGGATAVAATVAGSFASLWGSDTWYQTAGVLAGGEVAGVLASGEGLSKLYQEVEPTAVIGRLHDTRGYIGNPEYEVLNLPRDQWSISQNDSWVQSVIAQRLRVLVASPETYSNLWNDENEPTVFARELQQFEDAGYTQQGNYLIPPGH